MRKPHHIRTPIGEVTEYFDAPEKHGFKPAPVAPERPDEPASDEGDAAPKDEGE